MNAMLIQPSLHVQAEVDSQGVDVLVFVAVVCIVLSSTELCHLSGAIMGIWPNHPLRLKLFGVPNCRFERGKFF
jgi:hypothetical protein